MESVSAAAPATWNTKNLGLRLGADLTAAACAGTLVAPVITMIDRGIMENASGLKTLGESLKSSFKHLLLRPHKFLISKPFGLVFAIYSSTYLTANTLDTVSSTLTSRPASTITAGLPKFLATSTTNISISLYKDSQFTRMFGTPSATPRAVPRPTYALFLLRDSLTIFASFNLPPLLAPRLSEKFATASRHLGIEIEKHVSAVSAAQFFAPAAMQLFSTPLHLLGLDLYNRPTANLRLRAEKIQKEWGKSSLARMGRIIPAFGVGGVVNMRVRKELMGRLEGNE